MTLTVQLEDRNFHVRLVAFQYGNHRFDSVPGEGLEASECRRIQRLHRGGRLILLAPQRCFRMR